MPTLREFIDAAISEGCREGVSQREIMGPRGSVKARYLVGSSGVPYILPDIADDEHLTPTVLASMTRVLKVRTFWDLCAHLM
jgi:hypothetical protein